MQEAIEVQTPKRLYGIETRYVKGITGPVLTSTPIIRETEKSYITEGGNRFLGYKSRVGRDELGLAGLSPREAWEKWMAHARALLVDLRYKAGEQELYITCLEGMMNESLARLR